MLLSLVEGERHGYRLLQELRQRFEGMGTVGPATVYRNIAKMLADELIEEAVDYVDPNLDDTRGTYYRITKFGKEVATIEIERLAQIVQEGQAKGLRNASSNHSSGNQNIPIRGRSRIRKKHSPPATNQQTCQVTRPRHRRQKEETGDSSEEHKMEFFI